MKDLRKRCSWLSTTHMFTNSNTKPKKDWKMSWCSRNFPGWWPLFLTSHGHGLSADFTDLVPKKQWRGWKPLTFYTTMQWNLPNDVFLHTGARPMRHDTSDILLYIRSYKECSLSKQYFLLFWIIFDWLTFHYLFQLIFRRTSAEISWKKK